MVSAIELGCSLDPMVVFALCRCTYDLYVLRAHRLENIIEEFRLLLEANLYENTLLEANLYENTKTL